MKNNELLKNMPISQPVSAESLLITTTKSNGKSNPRLLPLTRTMLQPLSRNRKNTNLLSCKNSNITRITSMRKNMPRKSTIILTSSKNQKLFTLSPKILSVFSNPLSNENQTYNPNINCHGSSSHGFPY